MSNRFIPKEKAEETKLIWSTQEVQALQEALNKGYTPKVKSPFYDGNQNLKRGEIVWKYTEDELKEFFPQTDKKIYTTCVSSEGSIKKMLKKNFIFIFSH